LELHIDNPEENQQSGEKHKMVRPARKTKVDALTVESVAATKVSKVESRSDQRKHQDTTVGSKRLREDVDDGSSAKVAKHDEQQDESSWNEQQHKDFVAAIFQIGLRNSSPAVILENMTQKPESITSERVKSKLQKYRKSRDKSKDDFLEEYESFLQRAKAIECPGGRAAGEESPPSALLELMGSNKLLGGDAAAFLSYAVMKERAVNNAGEGERAVLSTQLFRTGALEYLENFAGAGIPFPQLTEAEKRSSLGVSMTFVMGLFLSMSQHLMRERSVAESITESNQQQQVPVTQRQIFSSKTTPGERSTKASFSSDTAGQYALESNNGTYQKNGEKTLNPTEIEMV
jgi:SHAQKYF class myb-like DNA-binding protein